MNPEALSASFNDLRNDLQAVARDAEALLKATRDASGERIGEIRARTEDTLRRVYDHLYERNLQMRRLAQNTDSYVREHSWRSMAIAAGVGLLVGLMIGRSSEADARRSLLH